MDSNATISGSSLLNTSNSQTQTGATLENLRASDPKATNLPNLPNQTHNISTGEPHLNDCATQGAQPISLTEPQVFPLKTPGDVANDDKESKKIIVDDLMLNEEEYDPIVEAMNNIKSLSPIRSSMFFLYVVSKRSLSRGFETELKPAILELNSIYYPLGSTEPVCRTFPVTEDGVQGSIKNTEIGYFDGEFITIGHERPLKAKGGDHYLVVNDVCIGSEKETENGVGRIAVAFLGYKELLRSGQCKRMNVKYDPSYPNGEKYLTYKLGEEIILKSDVGEYVISLNKSEN